jgi:hypothetical protein
MCQRLPPRSGMLFLAFPFPAWPAGRVQEGSIRRFRVRHPDSMPASEVRLAKGRLW